MKNLISARILIILILSFLFLGCQNKEKTVNSYQEEVVNKTLDDYGLQASNLFLYYNDLDSATLFYTQTLGMELIADYEMAKIVRMAGSSYLILVDATKGMHTAEEPKTVALALLTDQLEEWYSYLKDQNLKIKYELKTKEGSAHDGFVTTDPEGYLLEFERFNEHPENISFKPILDKAATILPKTNSSSKVPDGLGFKATVTWLYYKDILAAQKFYEEVLGFQFVADQGWTKILRVTDTGFIGLVDEKKGMHKFSETKAVNVSFIMEDVDGWFKQVQDLKAMPLRSDSISTGPEHKYRAFVGYDPEGYYLEFDTFYPHQLNDQLLTYLNQE